MSKPIHETVRTGSLRPSADRLDELRAQAALYRLVGRLLEEEIDAALLALIRGGWREALAEAGIPLDAAFFELPAETLLADLGEEFTGLFVAPGAVMPYRSVAETGRMFQAPADRVAAAYRTAGFEFRHRLSGEFPDHIGVMLSFVGVLLEQELEAREAGDPAHADALRDSREAFLREQVAPWGPGWCRRARRAAFHPFYRQLLAMIEQLLWQELATLVDRDGLMALAEQNRREVPRLDYDADFRKASGL